jgi:hypothetical protein
MQNTLQIYASSTPALPFSNVSEQIPPTANIANDVSRTIQMTELCVILKHEV